MSHDPFVAHETGGSDIDASKNSKHGKKGSKILGFFKGSTRTAVQTAIGTTSSKQKLFRARKEQTWCCTEAW